MIPEPTAASRAKGAIILLTAVFGFSCMGMLTKLATTEVSFVEAVFFRGLVGVPLLALLATRRGAGLTGRRRDLLTIRALAGTISVFMFYFAVSRIPVAETMLLNQMTPIFVLPLAVLLLKERVRRTQIALVVVALAGAALVIRPDVSSQLVNLPGLVALGSALFAAIAYVTVRKLAASDDPLTVVFWFSAASALIAAPPMLLTGFVWPGPRTLAILLTMGVVTTVAQLLLTVAYRHGEASRLAIIGTTGALFGAFFDWAIWSHLPDALTAAGGLTVLGACAALQALPARRTPVIQEG